MVILTEHPSPEELSAFSLGRLTPESARKVESHVSECSPCCETLLGLAESDTFVDLVVGTYDSGDSSETGDWPAALREHPRYSLVERIGRGGMGEVYKAKHLMMDRLVAIKVIHRNFFQRKAAVERFQHEVRAAARLSHPNIVTAYDAEQVEDQHLMAMEFVDGIDFARWVKNHGPMPWQIACKCILQAAAGLQHAHERGMVHRDIKPHNLMLVSANDASAECSVGSLQNNGKLPEHPQVKILDFGLARWANESSSDTSTGRNSSGLTQTGTLMGTPDFISPEQAMDAHQADIRSDLYSLGATFYFLLTGHAPFSEGDAAERLRKHAEEEPADIANAVNNSGELPRDLNAIVKRLLSKTPSERYQTPQEFIDTLTTFLGKHNAEYRTDDSQLDVADTRSSSRPFSGAENTRQAHHWPHSLVKFTQVLVVGTAAILIGMFALGWFETDKNTTTNSANVNSTAAIDSPDQAVSLPKSTAIKALAEDENTVEDKPVASRGSKEPQALSLLGDDEYYYFSGNLRDLNFEGKDNTLHTDRVDVLRNWSASNRWIWTFVALEGQGEAYCYPTRRIPGVHTRFRIALRVRELGDVHGHLMLPLEDGSDVENVPFTIPHMALTKGDKSQFYEAVRQHYDFLGSRNIPGAAWFRFRSRQAQSVLNAKGGDDSQSASVRGPSSNSLESTFGMLTGATAVSENLSLEDLLAQADYRDAQIDVSTLPGISVRPFNWDTLNSGIDVEPDPLAQMIPADQHVFFFRSFTALIHSLDHVKKNGAELLQLMHFQNENKDLLGKYQEQLGLALNDMARLIGPQLVQSIAVTGSDPDLETGTDVALIFETNNPVVLGQLFEAQISLSAQKYGAAAKIAKQEVSGIQYRSVTTPDRKLHSLQATIGNAVVIANSPAQFIAIATTLAGKRESILKTPEYKYFRNRYPIGDEVSGGLLVLTDQTIRRWAGPKWRIASSRRLVARGVMADMQAEYLHAKMTGNPPASEDRFHGLAGDTVIRDGTVSTARYGNLEFLTPISELEVDKVTAAEKRAYEEWRTNYERRWRTAFDPIAVHFEALQDSWKADLTVMPLTASSQYTIVSQLTRAANLERAAMDLHPESLFHFSMAIDKNSVWMNFLKSTLSPSFPQPIQMDPLSWMGETVSLYADAGDFWTDNKERFSVFDLPKEGMPIAFSVAIENKLTLLPFLLAARQVIEGSAPALTRWEAINEDGLDYVRVAMAGQSGQAVYYTITDKYLVFSPSKDLLKRAAERGRQRQLVNSADKDSNSPVFDSTNTAREDQADSGGAEQLLGKHVAMKLNSNFLKAWHAIFHANFEESIKYESWRNLPILNEWRRVFPDSNPLQVHEYYWKRNLSSAAGEKYVWNPKIHSLESNIFGAPGKAIRKDDYALVPFLNIEDAAFGLTFENSGLRARMNVNLRPKEE